MGWSGERQGLAGGGGQKTQRATWSSVGEHAIFLAVTPGHRCIRSFIHSCMPVCYKVQVPVLVRSELEGCLCTRSIPS